MSQCIVPNWNLKHQRQEQVEEDQEEQQEQGNRSSHVLNPSNTHLAPMSNYEIAELTWENGQLAMHGLSGLLPTAPTKPTWGRSSDTLESIVHQATGHNQKQNFNLLQHDQTPANRSSIAASSGGNWAERSGRLPVEAAAAALLKKRSRSDSDQCRKNYQSGRFQENRADCSACASASATLCRYNDTTMMTWASHESPQTQSMNTKSADEDSACHNGSENRDEDRETRDQTGRSHSTRPSRAAAIHNLSERRRRDRINQKMKTLQKLVPNANKTDKASMLDEVIEYLKQLQAEVQMMSMRSMPQMMMPLGMQQQHLQMALLARMGMGVGLGMGMGMLDINSMAAQNASQSLSHLMHPSPVTAPTRTFLPPPFVAPPLVPTRMAAQANSNATSNASVTLPDPYCAFLAQSMNMDLYNKMAALYRPQINQTTQTESSPSRSNNVQED